MWTNSASSCSGRFPPGYFSASGHFLAVGSAAFRFIYRVSDARSWSSCASHSLPPSRRVRQRYRPRPTSNMRPSRTASPAARRPCHSITRTNRRMPHWQIGHHVPHREVDVGWPRRRQGRWCSTEHLGRAFVRDGCGGLGRVTRLLQLRVRLDAASWTQHLGITRHVHEEVATLLWPFVSRADEMVDNVLVSIFSGQ